jgi:hypothetical protein
MNELLMHLALESGVGDYVIADECKVDVSYVRQVV